MRLALAQINSVVGDIDGNAARVVEWLERARDAKADLVLFPELVVTGYPPEDLLLRPGFVRAARAAVDEIARAAHGITALVGAPLPRRRPLQRVLRARRRRGAPVYRKRYLPNYGVFDEDRYFAPANDLVLLRLRRRARRADDLRGHLAARAARDRARARRRAAVANISASPFHVGKDREREDMLRVRALDNCVLRRALQCRRRRRTS